MAGLLAFVREWSRKLAGGIAASVFVVLLVHYGQIDPLEHWALDKLFELRGVQDPTTPIVIVTIDESSFVELNVQWPFPRAMHAQLLQKISAGNPLAIGVDVIFDNPSSRGPQDDEVLGAAVALAGNVVLGAAPAVDYQAFGKRELPNIPIPVIREGAAAVAPVNLDADPDGHIRRAPLRKMMGGKYAAAMDVQLHRLITKAGYPTKPLPTGRDILINFRGGPRTFTWVPYYQVLNGEVAPEAFRGKIVFIGPTSEVLHDVFPTAFAGGADMPGVEIHANVLENYIRGNRLHEIPKWITTTVAVLSGLFAAWLVLRLHALRAFLIAILVWTVLTACAFYGFYLWDFFAREMAPTLAVVLAYGVTVLDNFIKEQREKRRLSQFFSPDVLSHVVRERGTLGSKRRLVTVMFSDLRGFTSMSEKLEPEQVADILHEYLTAMTEIVFRHGGTVDKYIGDCVMALYNAPFDDPNHAANAVRTGLEFQEKTLEVSRKWEEKLGIKIRNGVGINTGDAVVGTMGSLQRLEYTAIGDTINLGARLESITKDYGASIIISESTHDYVKGQFLTRELGAVTVKGKTQPVKIFAVLPQDIRQYPRATLDAAATLIASDSEQECVVDIQDISEGGLAVKGLPEEWAKGKMIQIRCEGGGLAKTVIAEGSIVWRRDDLGGIQFAPLEVDAASTVTEYISATKR